MIGQSITKVIPKDKLYEEEDIVERLRKGERVDHFESKRLTKDGRLIDISLTISPVKNPAGKIIGASKIARDITIQKKMDRIIRDTEERFRMAVESTHLGTWDYLPLEGLLTWSKECRKIYDVPEGVEIDFDFFSKHIFPEDVDYVNNAVAKSMDPNGDGNYDIQYRVLRYSDKKPRWIRAQGKVLFDAQKQPERFIGTVLDITEEKNHEQQLKSSVELFRNMADSTPAIIWITSPDGFCTYFNKQWYDLTGQSARSALGFGWLDALHTEERKSVEEKFHAATQNHLPFNYEFRVCTTSGQYRWMLGVGSPKFQDNGIFEGFVGSVTDIHERKLAEERLKESEERLRMSVKSTGMGTWEFHPQTKKLIWSDESKKIFGLAESAEPDYQLISAQNYYEDKEFIEEEVNKILNNPGAGAFEIQHRIMRLSDNQQRWIKIQGKVIFNEKNIAQRLIGTMMDITNEKNREQQLIDSVELFRTMANNVPAMIWMSGTDKFQDFFNNTWLEFTGRTIDQERNDGWLEGVHPEDVSRCREVYDESVKKEKGFSVEYRLRRNDGEYRWISDNSAPRYGQDGRFAGFISASMDIDDQKRFREKIMESELLFKTISNASPAALWMTDRDEKNVFVNDTWIKWTGLDFDTQINRGWLNSVVEEDQVPTIAKFKECFREKKYFNTEFRFRRTDGELRWGFTEGYPFYDINEHFAGYAGSVTDITEIKKLEQRKDDFIKMASHELKTPITSISGYVQLLSNIYQDIDDDKLQLSKSTVKSSLGTISKQVSKLTRLITELLDLSKIESGRLDLHKTEFDLAILVNEIAQDMRQVSSRHAIAVNLEMDGKIYGDRDRIAQVLINLLTNAVKYSPDTDEVEITLTGSADEAIIRVKDQGIGIDKNEHQKIFERFYRAEGKREQTFPGFGIGLFIASEIIQRHGGKIEVESEKGKGSTFIVTLPTNPGKNE
jgi:PAS domain S-box-containing protein